MSKLFDSAIVFTDIHFGLKSNSLLHNQDCEKFVEWIIETAKQRAITNSFTRVLNIEKKMQNIRDDILEENGLNPSYTRQFKNSREAKVLAEYEAGGATEE